MKVAVTCRVLDGFSRQRSDDEEMQIGLAMAVIYVWRRRQQQALLWQVDWNCEESSRIRVSGWSDGLIGDDCGRKLAE